MPTNDEKSEPQQSGGVRKHQRILQEIVEEEEVAAPNLSLDWMQQNLEWGSGSSRGRRG